MESKSKSVKEIHWVSPNNYFGIQFRCSKCKSMCNEDWTKCSNCGTDVSELKETRTDIDTCWICGEKNNRKNMYETIVCENCRGEEKMFCKNDGTLMKRIEEKWLCPKCDGEEIGKRTSFEPRAKRRMKRENEKATGSKKRVVSVYGADEETKRRLTETRTPTKKKEISESRKKELDEVIEQMDEKGLLNEVKKEE